MFFNKINIKNLLVGSIFSVFISLPVYASGLGQITANDVNIRTSNSTDSNIYAQLQAGQNVSLNAVAGDFFEISYDGAKTLYVSKEYVEVSKTEGFINANGVNIRTAPSADASIISQASVGEVYDITGVSGEWYSISSGGNNAYVHKDFIEGDFLPYIKHEQASPTVNQAAPKNVYALVLAPEGLKLREQPNTASNTIQVLSNGVALDVLGQAEDWVQVELNGSKGYVSADYVILQEGEKPANTSSKADEMIAYAKKFIGTRYVYGGTNLSKGVDCSGFTYSVMKNFGIHLNRSSGDQAKNGISVSRSQLQKGDLIFFDTQGANNGRISHVGIYIGNGQFIHSSSTKKVGIIISDLNASYYSGEYVTARRVF